MEIIDYLQRIVTSLGFVVGIYIFLQRFHLRLQARFLGNVSDEIIKINDFCIEFCFKYHQMKQEFQGEVDFKLASELSVLRSKINNHLDCLTARIYTFPYGNPLNFFWFSLTGKYFDEKTRVKIDALLTIYQDKILDGTILQSDENILPSIELSDSLDQERIDIIVVAGLDIINGLEDHSRKLF